MGDVQMNLGPEELQKIGDYVRLHLTEWLPRPTTTEREINLVERIVRVEEELKSQRELMKQGFEAVDKRFVSQQWMMGLGFTIIAALMAVFNFY